MAGHRRKNTIFQLKFEDPEMEGLVVRARKPSMGGKLDMVAFQDLAKIDPSKLSAEDTVRLREMFEFFGSYLVSWNREDEDGVPVPCTVEGLLSEDDEFVLDIIGAWVDAVGQVSAPLGKRSRGGQPLEVASIPTEALLPNLVSSPGQS